MRTALSFLPFFPASLAQLRQRSLYLLVALTLVFAAFFNTQLNGDGIEYLSMTHAFASHGSAAMTPRDFEQIAAALGADHPAVQGLTGVHQQLAGLPRLTPHHGFVRTASGQVYAIHFWLYSLLATPFYLLVAAVGAKPVWCFALLNLSLVGATLAHLRRALPAAFEGPALVFLSLGTCYYLGWTGPEILAGCCAFSAAICMLRRDASVAVLLCGLGAAQNPSLALMIPVVLAHRLCAIRFASLCPLAHVTRRPATELALGAAGLIAALSSPLFFNQLFGVPSIIALYSSDHALISVERAQSFLFDLNIGVLPGMPGLFAGLLLLTLYAASRRTRGWKGNALFLLLASCVAAAPTLGAVNWNNGAAGVIRYGYWTMMPAAALIAACLASLPARPRSGIVAAIVLAQCLALYATGWRPGNSPYMLHTPLAHWALAHAPSLYNPEPEIAFERGRHNEASFDHQTSLLYRDGARPTKFLRHWSNSGDSAGLCAEGKVLAAGSVVEVGRGWEYLNAPFRCEPASAGTNPQRFAFATGAPGSKALVAGWSAPEAGGTWSLGKTSSIRIDVAPGSEVLALYFTGFYFHPVKETEVRINGQDLGAMSLENGKVSLPATLRRAPQLRIELIHPTTYSPARLGKSEDSRELGYHIKELLLRTRPL